MPLLFVLACLIGLPLCAQTGGSLRVAAATVSKQIRVDELDDDFEDVTSVVVTNTSGRTVQLIRETVALQRPRGWSYQTLDRLSRTAPYVMTETEQSDGRVIPLGPGQSATFYVVLRPGGVAGSGRTELRFSDLSLPGTVLAAATISTQIAREPTAEATPEARPPVTSVRLFPNPASDYFYVEAPRGTQIGQVKMTNTLGRQIRTFEGRPDTDGYDLRNLPDGLYLISIYDTTGKKLKTLRLLHRQSGA
jgi:hypothetical protein